MLMYVNWRDRAKPSSQTVAAAAAPGDYYDDKQLIHYSLSLIHISEPTRQAEILFVDSSGRLRELAMT